MAAALDAADGVIDGRFFGRPIVQAQPSFATTAPYGSYVSSAAPVFGGQFSSFPGSFPGYSAPVASVVPYASSAPYVHSAPQVFSSFGAPVSSFSSFGGNSALNLDAADGVIDGKFFGRNIVQSRPAFPTTSVYGGFPAQSVYSSFPGQVVSAPAFSSAYAPQFTQFAPRSFASPVFGGVPAANSALALDAADGVIDGKFFGSNIVGARPSFIPSVQSFPAQSFQSFPAQSFASAWPGSYAVGGFAPRPAIGAPVSYLPSTSMAPGNAALALDAADGVIDGRFHGRPIVQGGPVRSAYPQYHHQHHRSAQAQALDAADGVIDGRYHGRPIVERR